jgi:hypothetical protein
MVVQTGDGLIYMPMGAGSVVGEVFALSPVSGWLATVDDDDVMLYSTGFFRTGGSPYYPMTSPILNVKRDLSRIPPDDLIWRADGMQLAYADSTGVWVWDVSHWVMSTECDCSDPSLTHVLAVSADEPLARPTAFSSDGGLLRVEQDGEAVWIQITAPSTSYPDGFWSPDDRILITEKDEIPQFCARAMYFRCVAEELFVEIADERQPARVHDVAWHSPFEVTLWMCATDATDKCAAERYQSHGYWHPTYATQSVERVRLFAPHPTVGHLALVSGDSLLIDGKPIDLTGVEGEIVSLRWLRPLWAN